ncbi:MAG: DUF429 domain-containing protein [Planctomycetota bacterium]
MQFNKIIGIDFSGAAQSGKTAWAAVLSPRGGDRQPQRFGLDQLQPLGSLAGSDDRASVNRYLVDRMQTESETFWGCDFPFGLPTELSLGGWKAQLSQVVSFDGDAKVFGRSLVAKTQELQGAMHVRRTTDQETQTPFDCYHYRIIYQTFHGMRDVLAPLASNPRLAVLPFQYSKYFKGVSSVIVEACPSSTLKRFGLPYQKYKQSGGKPPSREHLATRRKIMSWVLERVEISEHRRRVIRRDPGGDALDAVLAALGSWASFEREDHTKIARHRRYPKEGFVYA